MKPGKSNVDQARASASRRRLLARAVLLMAAQAEVLRVDLRTTNVCVRDKTGKVIPVRTDMTVLLRSGTRVGVLVAPETSLARAATWPADVLRTSVEASLPTVVVTLSRRLVEESFSTVVLDGQPGDGRLRAAAFDALPRLRGHPLPPRREALAVA